MQTITVQDLLEVLMSQRPDATIQVEINNMVAHGIQLEPTTGANPRLIIRGTFASPSVNNYIH